MATLRTNNWLNPYQGVELAKACAILGRRADYETLVQRMESAAAGGDAKREAENWLYVASVHAAAGDEAKVADAVARSRAAAKLEENEWLDRYTAPKAYSDAGHFDLALAATRDAYTDPSNREIFFSEIIVDQLRAGRDMDAEKAAQEIQDKFRRLKALRAVLLARVRDGKTDGIAKWIDGHALPHERAVLNLAMAQQMLGIESRGMTVMFKMP